MNVLEQAKELHQSYENILTMKSDAQPFIFLHDGDVIFNPNCSIGGVPFIWHDDNDNCVVIFTKDDWNEAIWGVEEFQYDKMRITAIKEAIEIAIILH